MRHKIAQKIRSFFGTVVRQFRRLRARFARFLRDPGTDIIMGGVLGSVVGRTVANVVVITMAAAQGLWFLALLMAIALAFDVFFHSHALIGLRNYMRIEIADMVGGGSAAVRLRERVRSNIQPTPA